MRAPRWGGIAPWFCWWPPAALLPGALLAGKDALLLRLLPTGFCNWKRAGGSTRTLLHGQRDSCLSRWRTAPCHFRHLALPTVERAKRDSCQAWDRPSHSAKAQEYFEIPTSSPALASPTAIESSQWSGGLLSLLVVLSLLERRSPRKG